MNRIEQLEQQLQDAQQRCDSLTQQLAAERRQSELALQERQTFIDRLIQTNPTLSIYLYDLPSQTNVFISQSAASYLGYSAEDIQAMGTAVLPTLMHPEDQPHFAAHLDRLQHSQNGEVIEFEYRMRHRDGHWRWFYGRDQVYSRDGQGHMQQLLGTALDITDRKRRESHLRFLADLAQDFCRLETSDDILATVGAKVGAYLNISNCFFAEIDVDRNQVTIPYTWHTPAIPDITGVYPLDELFNGTFQRAAQAGETLVIGNTQTDARTNRDRCRAMEIQACIAVPFCHGGQWQYLFGVDDTVARQWREDEVEFIHAVAQCIFPRLERAWTEAALRRSEAEFRLFVSASSDIIYRTSADWQDMVQVAGKGIVADTDRPCQTWLETYIPPAERSRVWATLQTAIQHKRPFELEHQMIRQDGTLGWAFSRAIPRLDDQGEIVAWLGATSDISDRKQTERFLREQTHRLTLALQAGAYGIWEWDLVNNPIWDERMYEIYGLHNSGQAISYQDWRSHVHPNDIEPIEAETERTLLSRQASFSHDFRIWRADGELRWLQTFIQVRRDQAERPISVIGITRDITHRKQAELQQQDLADRLSLALQAGAIGTWDWDVISEVNWDAQMYAIYGLQDQAERAVYETWRDSVHPDDLPQTEALLHAALRGEAVYDTEFRIQRPDGELRWIYAIAQVQRDRQGRPTRVVGINQDITDRKAVAAALEESRDRLAAIMGALPDIVFRVDRSGQYLDFYPSDFIPNIASRQDIVGHLMAEVLPPDVAQGHLFRIEQALRTQRLCVSEQRIQVDGNVRYEEVRVAPCSGEEAVFVVRDISDRKAAEAQLRRTNEELARATRLKDEFLANMSHELRTPLNAILGMTEGLQEAVFGPITERQQRGLAIIERSGHHLLSLINDILDLSKIEAGQLQIDFAEVDVRALFSASLTFVKQQAYKKQLQLKTQLPDALPSLYGDDRRLRQVLINLLTNAIKFTPAGGQVTLAATYAPLTPAIAARREIVHPEADPDATVGVLTLAVTDTGIGISPADAQKLFQPFVQVDSALNRQYEGTGLGLALVRRIAEMHGGKVDLQSEIGNGSCFTVYLPVLAPPVPTFPQISGPDVAAPTVAHPKGTYPEAIAAPTPPPANTPAPANTLAPKLLLVEDNEASLETIIDYLTVKGYDLVVAHNGLEAVELAQTTQPALILMDIQMPQMDGFEAIARIRQLPTLAEVPIVALTALAMAGDRDRCLAAGANDYLSKPVRLKELIQKIQQLLPSPSSP